MEMGGMCGDYRHRKLKRGKDGQRRKKQKIVCHLLVNDSCGRLKM